MKSENILQYFLKWRTKDYNKYLFWKNYNNILVYCFYLTLVLLVSSIIIKPENIFVTASSILLGIYFSIIAVGIILKRKENNNIRYLLLLDGIFIFSSFVWIYYVANTLVSPIHNFYFFILMYITISFVTTYAPPVNLIFVIIITLLGSTLIDNNSYLWIILLSASLFSVIMNDLRYGDYIKIFDQNEVINDWKNRLKEMTFRDSLTNLYNNQYVFERLEYEIERSLRYKTPLSLILFDVDDFENIVNDYSQVQGDEILSSIGELLRNMCRATDVIGRFAGEKFILILPNTNLDDSLTLCERIRIKISNFNFTIDRQITISMGIKEFESEMDLSSFIDYADDLLYTSKENGIDRINY